MDFTGNYVALCEKTNDLSNYSLEELKHLLKDATSTHEEYDNLQKVIKGDSNSIYGSTGNEYYKLADSEIATDITMAAKHYSVLADKTINNVFANWGEKELETIQKFYPQVEKLLKLNYRPYVKDYDVCAYGDTDSRYIDVEDIYKLMICSGKKMSIPEDDRELVDFTIFLNENFIREALRLAIEEDCEFRNARKGYLRMAHEVTTRRSVLIKKKKYMMVELWEKGKYFDKPKLKFMGVEIKRGGTSPKMKKILTKLVEKMLLDKYTNEQLRIECLKIIKYIKATKSKEYIYRITSVSGMKNITKKENDVLFSSDKNHIQMQIAKNWINFIESRGLSKEYQKPFEGQRMNYYKCVDGSDYSVIGVPDDIDIDSVPGMPEPDWNQNLLDGFMRPFYRYISTKKDVTDEDCTNFLLGINRVTGNI